MGQLLEDMDTPKVVQVMLDRLGRVPKDRRCEYERQFKLGYYFGGLTVAARDTDRGLDIVASGPAEEVGEVIRSLPPEQTRQLAILTPEPLESMIPHLPPAARTKAG